MCLQDLNSELGPAVLCSRPLTSDEKIPAKKWLESQKKSPSTTVIPLTGNLTIKEQGQISNWFNAHVPKAPLQQRKWVGLLPLVHAITLFIAARLVQVASSSERKQKNTMAENIMSSIEEAWKLQVNALGPRFEEVDVKKECLASLESLMFKNSKDADVAGHQQWGLNAGDHQDCWNPYEGLAEVWNVGDRVGSDSELEVKFSYSAKDEILRA
jgi:hypothetical protein